MPERSRSPTPPHHPIHGVSLPEAHIEKIAEIVFPGREAINIRQLESGKSFNNRIYYLDFPGELQNNLGCVLKVNGRFFGADKIQNEVSCLNILGQYCPDIPSPSVVAWSEDGTTVAIPGHPPVRLDEDVAPSSPGWILMTRVPGSPVSDLQLNDDDMTSICEQLADMVAQWRLRIPPQTYCGNLTFHSGPSESADIRLDIDPENSHGSHTLAVRGLVDGAIRLSEPIASEVQLHRIRLEAKLCELNTDETYSPNRRLAPEICEFIEKTLPRLFHGAPSSSSSSFVFTSYDLAPRNVLVVRTDRNAPPKISGIIDFEFAGFFPEKEEFMEAYVAGRSDWGEPGYSSFLKRLQQLGVDTPPIPGEGSGSVQSWTRERLLSTMIDNIAPWWLPGPYEGEELAIKLAECLRGVETAMRLLKERVPDEMS
ncbi:kinase-like domain protein [Echria macrotheca]|uniref:Kinase-like domain protein n=1 Tax=Echria macrotheca TaxID=438768 RepID=A0AAJ0FF68_9PEZI|nr:kinase-like domain protein [Echria macrotheca]